MSFKFSLLSFFLLSYTMTLAQKNIDPTQEDIQFAKKLREQYTKDDIAILESNESISFGVSRDNAKVTVVNSIDEKLMNINHRADIQKYEFYDSASNIETFNLKYRNDKKANFMIRDEFYKDNDLFYNDARVKYMQIDFPVQGYSYSYELDKKYDDVKYFNALYFNDEYPILKKQITITVPEWLNLELKEFNFNGNNVKKTQTKDSDNNTVYTYTLENVPGYFKEDNSPGRSYLYPHLILIAKSYTAKNKEVQLFNNAADLYKWYKSLVDQMKDNTEVMKAKVTELTAKAKTDEEKIKNIYYWVQDNIRYIAFEDGIAGFKPDESNNVFEKRYGDCKGMANLIKQMLKLAGFDARLTWIGTKHIAYDYTTPSLAVDNHMICTLFYKGKKYFLDGTEKYNSFGDYAERIQNKEAMIEDGDQYIIEKVPNGTAGNNKDVFRANLTLDNDKLVGKAFNSFSGESKTQFLYNYNSFASDKKQESLENYLSKGDKNIHIASLKTSDLKNREQLLTIDYDLDIANKVSSFDNETYIDVEFLNEYKGGELKDRKTDYVLNYKRDYEATTTLKLPAGYKVTKLPDNLTVTEDDFNITISFQQNGPELVYKKTFLFKNGIIKAHEMDKWNAAIKKLNTVYNQQITLVKS